MTSDLDFYPIWTYSVCVCFNHFILCAWGSMLEVRREQFEGVGSLHHLGPRDLTSGCQLVSRCIYPFSHLTKFALVSALSWQPKVNQCNFYAQARVKAGLETFPRITGISLLL